MNLLGHRGTQEISHEGYRVNSDSLAKVIPIQRQPQSGEYEPRDFPLITEYGEVKVGRSTVHYDVVRSVVSRNSFLNVFMPGLYAPTSSYGELTGEIAFSGEEVAIFRVPHDSPYQVLKHPKEALGHTLHPTHYAIDAASMVIDTVCKRLDIKKVRLVGHSGGGPIATGVGVARPEIVDAVTVISGAGTTCPISTALGALEQSGDFINVGQAFVNYARGVNKRSLAEIANYYSNPIQVGVDTIVAGMANITDDLKELREQDVTTAAMQPIDDKLFRDAEVRRRIGGLVDIFAATPGGHLAPHIYAAAVAGIYNSVGEEITQRRLAASQLTI